MTLPAPVESLKLEEVAALYEVTPQTLLRKAKRGEFAACYKVGRHWWVRMTTLRAWQRDQEIELTATRDLHERMRLAGRRPVGRSRA